MSTSLVTTSSLHTAIPDCFVLEASMYLVSFSQPSRPSSNLLFWTWKHQLPTIPMETLSTPASLNWMTEPRFSLRLQLDGKMGIRASVPALPLPSLVPPWMSHFTPLRLSDPIWKMREPAKATHNVSVSAHLGSCDERKEQSRSHSTPGNCLQKPKIWLECNDCGCICRCMWEISLISNASKLL